MNGYIINPMIFYWMSVIQGMKIFNAVMIVVLFVGIIIALVAIDENEGFDEDLVKKLKTLTRWFVAGMFLCGLLVVFLPSKTTMMEMLVAKYATYENAELTVEGLKSVVHYIIEEIRGLK